MDQKPLIDIEKKISEKYNKGGMISSHAHDIFCRMSVTNDDFKKAIVWKHIKNLSNEFGTKLVQEALTLVLEDEKTQ